VVAGNRVAGFRITNQGGGAGQSEFIVQVDKFALVDTSGGAKRIPFMVQGGVVYIDQAAIRELSAAKIASGTITAAYIYLQGSAATIGSSNYDYNNGLGWIIRGDGWAEFNNLSVRGYIRAGADLKSTNFNTGVAGWIIRGNGDAEFNNVLIRGLISNTAGIFHEGASNKPFPAIAQQYGAGGGWAGLFTGGEHTPIITFYGWMHANANSALRFGRSSQTFGIFLNMGCSIGYDGWIQMKLQYKIDSGAWVDIGDFSDQTKSYMTAITVNLNGGSQIQFGMTVTNFGDGDYFYPSLLILAFNW
jgi:hypothetical protein